MYGVHTFIQAHKSKERESEIGNSQIQKENTQLGRLASFYSSHVDLDKSYLNVWSISLKYS